jgi:hypothetical protein
MTDPTPLHPDGEQADLGMVIDNLILGRLREEMLAAVRQSIDNARDAGRGEVVAEVRAFIEQFRQNADNALQAELIGVNTLQAALDAILWKARPAANVEAP